MVLTSGCELITITGQNGFPPPPLVSSGQNYRFGEVNYEEFHTAF